MNRFVSILLAFVFALVIITPSASFAMGGEKSQPVPIQAVDTMEEIETAEADCCKSGAHAMSDAHGHCGVSCSILTDSYTGMFILGVDAHEAGAKHSTWVELYHMLERPPRHTL